MIGLPALAALPTTLAALSASVLLGAALGLLAHALIRLLLAPRKDLSMVNLLEHQRRTALREQSSSYRRFEPLVDELEPLLRPLWAGRLPDLQHQLELLFPQAPWKAGEYLVVKQIEALPGVLAAAAALWLLFGPLPALTLGALFLIALPALTWMRMRGNGQRYRITVRNHLPFVVDLMALLLESGAIFRECLETAAAETRDHPVGEELSRVCRAIDQGVPQSEALRGMGRRIEDADVLEMVFVINTAEERGTRLKETLADLAEQMRTRRIQWLERAAEEAKVHITWPGMLVMVGCLLIVVAPLLLSGLGSMDR